MSDNPGSDGRRPSAASVNSATAVSSTKAKSAGYGPNRHNDVYYHGGVSGRQPGDVICPALDLGRDYTAEYAAVRGIVGTFHYRPEFVYMTTHLGAARGYAARYKNLGGVHRPGDVYIVEPQSELLSDPEYDNPNDPGHFVMTPVIS